MIRRFVNLVAANYDSRAYSLHRLDVAKHLFYPSTAEAEAANAKEEDSHDGGGDKPRRPSRIERLRRLPEPTVRFQQFPPPYQYVHRNDDADDEDDDDDDDEDVAVEVPRIWSPRDEMFVLLSPRNSRIFHATEGGQAVLYDSGDDDDSAGSITTQPSLALGGPNGLRPIAIPIITSAAAADGDGRGRHGKAEKESLYVMSSHYDGRGHSHSFQVLDISQHPRKWEPLAPPPLADNEYVPSITSFTVLDGGSTICVSTKKKRTYCFDTRSQMWHAGDWMLPFDGRAEYVAELDACLGLRYSDCYFDDHGHLCASSDLHAAMAARREPTLQHVWEDLSPPPPEEDSIQLSRRFNDIVIERRKEWKPQRRHLINLGGGRLCIAKVFQVEQVAKWGFDDVTQTEEEFVVLTGVEVLRDGEGEELRMVKHRSKRYMFNTDVIQWVL